MLGCHADAGIANRELELNGVCQMLFHRNRHQNLAVFGELDCVVDQIDENLAETQRITNQIGRDIVLRGDQKLKVLVLSSLANNVREVIE